MADNTPISAAPADLTRDQLRRAVLGFVENYSIDTTPYDAAEVERYPEYLPTNRRLYVGQPPGIPIEQVLLLAEQLHAMGYAPIPQLAARELASEAQLRGALERFKRIGVTEALIVAGDREHPAGPYESTLALLGTGLLADHGIINIGVAGYPEGNRLIGPTALNQALAEKADLAAACGWRLYVVTQLSFDPAAVIAWIERTAKDGLSLPVLIGLPGLGSLRDLIGYSRRCGVGASMRALVEKSSSLPHLTALSTTGDLILEYARRIAERPDLPILGARFYAFAGLEEAVTWIERLRAGRFKLTADENKLRLEA